MIEYQEFIQWFRVLQSKPNWLFDKDNENEQLIALEGILEIGLPSMIGDLIPFLKSENDNVRDRTCEIITLLYNKIQSKKEFYHSLKHCGFEKADFSAFKQNFSVDKFNMLLTIASLNWSGYIREEAVKLLANTNDKQAIPFLIFRLADWVEPVRKAAYLGLKQYKKQEFLSALIENLPLIEWLQKVERTNLGSIYKEVLEFIIIENKAFVFRLYPQFSDKIRFLIAKNLINQLFLSSEEVELILKDRHFSVRQLMIDKFSILSNTQINQLLNDKSAKIRLAILYKLKELSHDFNSIVFPFLADNSASIREFSRFVLRGNDSDFSRIYYENLLKNKQIFGSILGLAETNGKEYNEILLGYWAKDSIKIKKIALSALMKLDEDKAYHIALDSLDSDLKGIRNISIDFLSQRANIDVLSKARTTYLSGNKDVQISMIKMFHIIGSWAGFSDLILGTINEDEEIRRLSVSYIQLWKNKAIRRFTKPSKQELERIQKVFELAYETHVKRQFFKMNPLVKLDFYFK